MWRGTNYANRGAAVLYFQVNEPPEQGNCTVVPHNGTGTETRFNVDCTEFEDQHKPLTYEVSLLH